MGSEKKADTGAGEGASEGDVTRTETTKETTKVDTSNDVKDAPKYTEAQMQTIVKERLRSEKEANERKTEKAKKDAQDAALAQNGEYQRLAEERAQDVKRLSDEAEVKESRIKQLEELNLANEAAIGKQLESLRKGLPKHITELLDGLAPPKQLEWLAKNRSEVDKANSEETTDGRNLQTPSHRDEKKAETSDDDSRDAKFQPRVRF